MNILLVSSTLSTGGITSFAICLANELAKDNDVTLACCTIDKDRIQNLNPEIKIIYYKKKPFKDILLNMVRHGWVSSLIKIKFRKHNSVSPMASIAKLHYASAEIIELPEALRKEYDLAISTSEFFCNDVLAMKINAKKKAGWIHPDYQALNPDVELDRIIFNKLDFIVTVSEINRCRLLQLHPECENKALYIPNLLNVDNIELKAKKKPDEYLHCTAEHIIVSVCRLDNSSKRIDRAINIARALKQRGDSFEWFVVGEGSDRSLLQNLIEKYGIQDCFHLLGERKNPYPYIAYADLMVLTSQYEGKPITVDEALILHCPVMVTHYSAAPEQITEDCGIIVDNDDSTYLENALDRFDWDQIAKRRQNCLKYDHFKKIYFEFKQNGYKLFN